MNLFERLPNLAVFPMFDTTHRTAQMAILRDIVHVVSEVNMLKSFGRQRRIEHFEQQPRMFVQTRNLKPVTFA